MAAPSIPGLTDLVEIGRGGFGVVYRAFEADFERVVAVKVIGSDADGAALRRFARERSALGRLSNHPNIVSVYTAGILDDGRAYLVMEYLEGGSLDDRLRERGRLPVEEVLAYGVQLAGALASAHALGVVHRDVKPHNVLLTSFGTVQLADFGIAALTDATRTTAGVTATIAHVAPEVLDNAPPSPASDVYALGSTLFMLLAGHTPFERMGDQTMAAVLARIATQPPPDLRPLGVPAVVAGAVEAMLAKHPSSRPESAVAAGRALQAAQRQLGSAPTVLPVVGLAEAAAGTVTADEARQPSDDDTVVGLGGPPTVARPGAPRHRAMPVVLAVVIVVGLVAGGVLAAVALRPDATATPVAVVTTDAAPSPDAISPSATAAPTDPSSPPPTTPASTPTGGPGPARPSGPPRLLTPTAVFASGTAPAGFEASGESVFYDAEQVLDADPSTAWRVPGDGVGETLEFAFGRPVQLAEIGLVPGYDKIDPIDGTDRFTQNRRVVRARAIFDDGTSVAMALQDDRRIQFTRVDVVTSTVTLEILEVTDNPERDFTAISEVVFRGR
ncbi:MAG: protein kinase [Actinobacteria bacterium]|nr:protein kinase [Actinomycetota bacterium]